MKFQGLCQVLTCRADNSEGCKRPGNEACYLKLQAITDQVTGEWHDKPIRSEVKVVYHTHVETGACYTDKATGFVGTATAVHFYRDGTSPRATLSRLIDGRVVDHTFDVAALERADQPPQTGFQVGGGTPAQWARDLDRQAKASQRRG